MGRKREYIRVNIQNIKDRIIRAYALQRYCEADTLAWVIGLDMYEFLQRPEVKAEINQIRDYFRDEDMFEESLLQGE